MMLCTYWERGGGGGGGGGKDREGEGRVVEGKERGITIEA